MTITEMLLKEIDYHLMMARGKTVSLPDSDFKKGIQFRIDEAWEYVSDLVSNDAE